MAELPEFQKTQFAFAAHIRDPDNVAAPAGVEDRRMAIYRELFFNNIRNLLAKMFPVIRHLHTDDKWHGMIRQFMQKHRAETPYFLQLPQEFLTFLQNEYAPLDDDYPFLLELAHYEYVELALSISEQENDFADVDADGDLLLGTPVKSVLAWTYAYQFPVHRISTSYIPVAADAQPVFLAIYRQANDHVAFLELNAVTAGLLERIDNNNLGANGADLLRSLAREMKYTDIDAFLQHGATALEELRQLQILTGVRASTQGVSNE